MPQQQPQNPGSSLSDIWNYVKSLPQQAQQFMGGAGALQQAAGNPGGGQAPPPQNPGPPAALQPGQPNPIMEGIGRALLGKSGNPMHQNPAYIQGAIDRYMAEPGQSNSKGAIKKTAGGKSPTPQTQADSAAPFTQMFQNLMSKLTGK